MDLSLSYKPYLPHSRQGCFIIIICPTTSSVISETSQSSGTNTSLSFNLETKNCSP